MNSVEWNDGMERWIGLLECHAHKIVTNVHNIIIIIHTLFHGLKPGENDWKKATTDHNWSKLSLIRPTHAVFVMHVIKFH